MIRYTLLRFCCLLFAVCTLTYSTLTHKVLGDFTSSTVTERTMSAQCAPDGQHLRGFKPQRMRRRGTSLLLGISFYHYSAPGSLHCDSGIHKGSNTWNEAMVKSLVQQVIFSEQYSEVDHVKVVVDTNDAAVLELYCKAAALLKFDKTDVHFHIHSSLSHPFHLTSRHRLYFAKNIGKFTHFMYTEVDTVMPPATFSRQFREAGMLWAQKPPAVRTFTRMCTRNSTLTNDSAGFFDIRYASSPRDVLIIDGRHFVTPNSTYAACWVYPRDVLKAIMKTERWDTASAKYTTPTGLNAIRELQSKPLHNAALVPLDSDMRVPSDAYVWHLGGSGDLYCSRCCSHSVIRTFLAKSFVYLINSERGRTTFVDDVLVSHYADAFVLSWNNPDDSRSDLFVPNSTWASGRNALYEYVRQRELQQGWEYEYYIFMDEDAIRLECDDNIATFHQHGLRPFDHRRRCWSAFEERLLRDRPALAVPHAKDVPLFQTYNRNTSEEAVCIFKFDAQLNAFARHAARAVLPYLTFGGRTWTSGAKVVNHRIAATYAGDVLMFPQFYLSNKEHRKYAGSGKHGGMSKFPEDLRYRIVEDEEIFICSSLTPDEWKISQHFGLRYDISDCSSEIARISLRGTHDRYEALMAAKIEVQPSYKDSWCLLQNCRAMRSDNASVPCLRPQVELNHDLVQRSLSQD